MQESKRDTPKIDGGKAKKEGFIKLMEAKRTRLEHVPTQEEGTQARTCITL